MLNAIVIAVSSFEEYVKSTIARAVAESRVIEGRFSSELGRTFRYDHLLWSGGDARKAIGEAVASSFSFTNPKSVLDYLQRITSNKVSLDQETWCDKLSLYQSYRNVAVHAAGLADAQFLETSGYNGKLGEPIVVSREFASSALEFFAATVKAVESNLA